MMNVPIFFPRALYFLFSLAFNIIHNIGILSVSLFCSPPFGISRRLVFFHFSCCVFGAKVTLCHGQIPIILIEHSLCLFVQHCLHIQHASHQIKKKEKSHKRNSATWDICLCANEAHKKPEGRDEHLVYSESVWKKSENQAIEYQIGILPLLLLENELENERKSRENDTIRIVASCTIKCNASIP